MKELNVEFKEEYKRLDALCKDLFHDQDGGVSAYIREMELTDFRFRRYAEDWDYVYSQLKHMRWIRNQLAHEVGAFDSDICTNSDIKWLTDFHNSILNVADPLAIVGQVQRSIQKQQNYSNTRNKSADNNDTRISLWGRIKAKIKSWFHK